MNNINKCIELGSQFHKFLRQNLPHYIIPFTNSGFNFSFCNINNDEYICSIRYRTDIKVLFGKNIIPGDYKKGKNFVWGRWNDPRFIDATCIFVCEWINNKLIVKEDIKPTFIWSQPVCKPKRCMLTSTPLLSDFRLFKYENRLFMIDGNVSIIREITIDRKSNKILINDGLYLNYICGDTTDYCYDKNWSYVNNTDENNFIFLNWIKDGYIIETKVINVNNCDTICETNKIIKLGGNHIIDGLGDFKTPMFSFGSSCIKINNNTYMGVGHAKILLTQEYDSDSKIYKFRKIIFDNFNNNPKYVQHNSYIYCMYFFKYIINNNKKLYISDCYLPILSFTDYFFSIYFPMSIIKDRSNIVVTGGYGDYYSIAVTFKYKVVIKNTKHDVSNFNINEYNYNFIYC
ncbi:unknown similar to AMEV020 [Choristoneura rosaceana entomopoxvirus 'L']|uniref:Uncharacterized protein n=1 Tax=Choristoneura rosaceana entomopoxvirus 'L' TaxID=1293539 RepID=A0ABM9QK61_9POXV|nr:unknown similar to AMEV020 [Choristoneura rosaceana entomopoxvirus 'L']CCU55930.1 unknown similar to AMEV020 [Choristoneura rosaceana entomopoxvirus 'L']